jgi:uncharacterized protein
MGGNFAVRRRALAHLVLKGHACRTAALAAGHRAAESAPSLTNVLAGGRYFGNRDNAMAVDAIVGLSATEIIGLLDLQPQPEGGFFRETFRDPARDARGRAVSTLIYYLLDDGQVSRWHRVDATEVWHFYAGAPLEISISQNGSERNVRQLGPDLVAGERPQCVVPAHCWQSAKSLGAWTLVGCSVAPGFEFSGFELAPLHWSPAESG